MLRAVGSMKITQTTVQSQYHAYSAKLPSLNTDEMRRLVGYSEYSRSLSLLDAVVARATTEELQLMDQIIASRGEFTVYTNISRRIPKQTASSLDEPAADAETFAKRNLAWMMALARVEVGAMVAGFTGQRDPFAVVPPTAFERQAYAELLLDGARTHYWSLANDPVAVRYASYRDKPVTTADKERGRAEIDEAQAIAYGRRVALAREFVQATREFGRGQLTPQQAAELAAWERQLTELVDTIAYKVLGLGDTSIAASSSSTRTKNIKAGALLSACPFLRCDSQNRPLSTTPATGTAGATKTDPRKTDPRPAGQGAAGGASPGPGASGGSTPGKSPAKANPAKEKAK